MGPGKTFSDTNMLGPGRNGFQPPYDLILQRYLFLFPPSCCDGDRDEFIRAYNWEFWILCKLRHRLPVGLCAASGKPQDLVEKFGSEDPVSNIQKLGTSVCFELGAYALYLPPLVGFAFNIDGQPFIPARNLDFFIFLDGLRDVPVQ